MFFANSRIRFFKTSWLNCEQYGKNKCKKKGHNQQYMAVQIIQIWKWK